MKITVLAAASAILAIAASAAVAGHHAVPGAHLTMQQARALAVKARAGRIVASELEREAGGSGLRYSFDVKTGGHIYEVGVDAQDGRVLENKAEGPHPD